MFRILILCLSVALPVKTLAQQSPQAPESTAPAPMTVDLMAEIISALDPGAQQRGPTFEFVIQDVPVIVITDPRADRMRAMVPIRSAEGLEAEELMRLMQANFDSALDARYAIAQGRLWGVFIHPLSPLEPGQFVSGLAQTVNVALTYGQTYSGGASVFGGGNSNGIFQDLIEELERQGQEL
ncbi:MAG: hypothetical protein V2I76_05880 [Roseobacter sp.]|jgi:hypothetical protein|nr:hypothetical protein [Roseobacter sp.]